MKSKLIAKLALVGGLLASGSAFAQTRIGFGVSFGAPVVPVAPVPVAYAAPYPGPGYVWVGGGYTFVGGRRVWNAGYWRAPVIAPRYDNRVVVRGGFDRYDHRGYERGFRR
jgi:hypothetical protein